jgi:hypothetical protein
MAPSSADDQRGYNTKIFAVTDGILGEPGGRSDYLDAVAHGGWVGVTTYTDNHGELRIKTETLVAMSGITTGNRAYPIT